jgi:hypothetical protein
MRAFKLCTFLLLSIGTFSCIKEPVDLDFPIIVTNNIIPSSWVGSVGLRADIINFNLSEVIEYGFIYADSIENIEIGKIVSSKIKPEGFNISDFGFFISNLKLNATYYYQPYAVFKHPSYSGLRKVYGEIHHFTNNIEFSVPMEVIRNGNTAKLSSDLIGLQTRHIIPHHGYVYSAVNEEPKLGESGTYIIDLGELLGNENFEDQVVTGLHPDSSYHFRSFIFFNNFYEHYYYSEGTGTF